MKLLVVGDLHFKEIYPYAEKFEDRRLDERQAIEDAIVEAAKGCAAVVLMGDVFDSRQNSYKTVQAVTSFIERFENRKVFIMAGNHENSADGTSALDYLKEISDKTWHVISGEVVGIDGLCFVPYFRRSQYGVETDQEVVERVLDDIGTGHAAIFIHHAIGGSRTVSGQMTDLFHEPVFSLDELQKRASKKIFGSHIHYPQQLNENAFVLGSVMNFDIGEIDDKRVIQWDTETDKIKSIPLPGRKFAKLVNPTKKELEAIKDFPGLVRIITDKPIEVPAGFSEAVSIMETPKESRKKIVMVDDFSIENLLTYYAKARNINLEALLAGYHLINK